MGYAIIETGGKQYRVQVGDRVTVEKLLLERGAAVTFDKVLAIEENGKFEVGTPYLPKATVTGKVDQQRKTKRVRIFKMKPKKNERKRRGHRQAVTDVRIERIVVGGK